MIKITDYDTIIGNLITGLYYELNLIGIETVLEKNKLTLYLNGTKKDYRIIYKMYDNQSTICLEVKENNKYVNKFKSHIFGGNISIIGVLLIGTIKELEAE